MTRPTFSLFALGCLLTAGSSGLHAAGQADLNSLLSNSPFGSAASGAATPQNDAPLEFRGVFAEGGDYFFNLYSASAARSEWLGLDDTYGDNVVVKSYDPANQQLTVQFQGKPMTLSLVSARRPAAPTPARPTPAVKGQPEPAVVAPATPTSEQERLSKIAEEIRRRRALRQQALQKDTK